MALAGNTRSYRSQARPSSRTAIANTAKTPAATPTTAPRTSLEIFSETSALASSISSRTSVAARSEMSWIADAIWGEALSRSSGAKALEDEGEGDAAQEGGAEQDLGPGLGFGVAEARVAGGRRERGVDLRDGLGLAGGGLGLGLRGIA